jgi:hypothetical protein
LDDFTQTLRYRTGGSRYSGNKYGASFLKVSVGFTYIIDQEFNIIIKKITNLLINVKEKNE